MSVHVRSFANYIYDHREMIALVTMIGGLFVGAAGIGTAMSSNR